MAQPSRRVTPSSTDISLRKKTGESAPSSNSVVNGVAAVKPKVSKNSAENSSPYNQTISSMAKTGHTNGELSRRVSQREKPAIPAKPPLSKVPPVRNGKTNGVTSVSTTTTVSHKTQSHGASSGKRDSESRVNGTEQKKTNTVNCDSKSPNAKGRVSLEITLEKKITTPVVRRKTADREGRSSTTSSSEESSPSQSPTKSVHFKSSRSSSASSLDSRDRLRLGSMPGSVPRYQTHTISSADKVQGRAKSATSRTSPGVETSSDTCLNGFSSGPSVEPIRRSRARSVGPIRRVHSNEMVRPKRDISPSPKSKDSVTVRSKSVERTRNRQSFGGFVQRQRQAWEERSTVTRRPPSGNQSEKSMNRRSLDPNHAPKIMQQSSVSVTQRKHMLFGKGTAAQKVKSKLEENPVNKPTSPTSIQNKQDVSQQVPKVKSSSADVEVRSSAKTEVSGQIGSRGNPQGDSVLNTDQKRTSSVDNPPEKPSVLQEIAPSPGSKPNAPNSLPLKPTYQNADANHRISPAKENDIGQLVTSVDLHAGDAVDETDNGKIHLFIDEDRLLGSRTDAFRPKPNDVSDIEGKKREEYANILGLTDPKELTKTDTLTSLTAVDDNILEVEGKVEAKDLAKEKEKAGITNGEDMGEKDGHYFLRVVNEEQSRIEALCRRTEQNLDDDNLSDEASGVCRAALGKANLLTSKKFKQFRGLCEQNITPSEEAGRCTTASDLAGFWDMVMIQVDDINSMFADIEKMKENNWKMPVAPAVTKPLTRKTPTKLSGRSYGRQVSRDKDDKDAKGSKDSSKKEEKESRAAKMRQAREEARKRLIAAKKQAARTRIKSNSSETEVEIYTASGQQQA